MRRQIPLYAPEWTDHNDSDPGITLIQLFSHLAEMIGYRLNQLPDKAYVEMLQLVGVRMRPAEAARTWLSFILAKPEAVEAFQIDRGGKVRGKTKGTPPVFELDTPVDAVPAQLAALVTTQSDDLRDIARGTAAPLPADTAASYLPDRFALAWDGKTPKLKDWPAQPLPVFARPSEKKHDHLWLGLAFNPGRGAGFLGQRVTLVVQLDDDEQPDPLALADCRLGDAELATSPSSGPVLAMSYYRPAQPGETTGSFRPVNLIADSTEGLTRSGMLRFDVPTTLGFIPDTEWLDVRPPPALTMAQICAQASSGGGSAVLPKPIAHPLVGAIKAPVSGTPSKVPISGWLRLDGIVSPETFPRRIRAITFNAAPATNAETVTNEFVGVGTGFSDQTAQLDNANVLPDSLELAVEDVADGLLHAWKRVEDFDLAGPDDRVFVLDPEAGTIFFGDGLRGSSPGLDMRVIALRYRHGGGKSAELAAGLITQPDSLPSAVQDVTNFIAARGGKDAETLDQAKRRAPQELRVRGRAVTADDFAFLAQQTPGVRIARAIVVPLHRPYQASGVAGAPGLDIARIAPGVVSVVAVPDELGPFPTPTEGMLRTVCRYLDRFRLVTTEVYVAPPQYVRLFQVEVTIGAKPGFTRTQLREAVATQLETYFHVLRGGPDGTGFPFGSTIHHADLVAQVFRVAGVDYVESLTAQYDGNAPGPPGEPPPMQWRRERLAARRLTGCRETPLDDGQVLLAADECVFVDSTSLNVVVLT
ncbi:MAG: putative baseplate assembly protein [Deltaproteobacteria bacterium]|nr:putative baseplate assembly protein [Deltaproteobacteria bacterium]